jgi:benzoyl-CoA reductase/2-hydroxyglutaryl-CoA dehydratase subunit BcrC/BadD/HgdB
MAKCCGNQEEGASRGVCGSATSAGERKAEGPLAWFDKMIEHCYSYAQAAKAAGKPIVGILCEYTPRELIMAAGGVPICLCGGSASTIPAAEQHLPANLCALIKSTYGYHLLGSNPFLEMADLVVGETTCDGKKKMYELMAETRPMYVLQLPHKAADGAALEYWHRELEKFRAFLAERFGVEITDCKIREAVRQLNRERALRRELAALMKSDCPPLTGRQLLACKSSIWAMPEALEQYELAIAALRGTDGEKSSCGEVAQTIGQAGKVRVMMTGVPMVHGAERMLNIVEDCGGLVVAMENCTGLKPLEDDIDETAADPMQAISEKYFSLPCSVMTPNDRRLELLRRLAADYRPECVIELIWQACLTYDVESHRVKRFVEEELKLPYLRIETDYSPSDSSRINVRVEALMETVRAHR